MKFVRAGFGQDLDAPVTKLVVFRRDINLTAVRPRRRAGESGELGGELIGIVGELVEIFVLQNNRTGVAARVHADRRVLGGHFNILLGDLND